MGLIYFLRLSPSFSFCLRKKKKKKKHVEEELEEARKDWLLSRAPPWDSSPLQGAIKP